MLLFMITYEYEAETLHTCGWVPPEDLKHNYILYVYLDFCGGDCPEK